LPEWMLSSAVCKTLSLFALMQRMFLSASQLLHVRQAALQYMLGMHMGTWLAMVVAAGVVICIAVVLFVHPVVQCVCTATAAGGGARA
jgi:uncharacterized membrane protein